MRDIRADLQHRAALLRRQIAETEVRHERLVAQARHERDARVAGLKRQLEAIDRIATVAAWQKSLRHGYAAAIAVLSTATELNEALLAQGVNAPSSQTET